MFSALAEAQVRDVPKVRKRSVSADNEGVSVMDGDSIAGTGYKEYADVVVRTIRKESRGFESARSVLKRRFIEFLAVASACVVRIEAASSWVSTGSCSAAAAAASRFSRCLFLWGSSSGMVAVNGTGTGSSFGIVGGIRDVKDVEVLALPFEIISFAGRNVLFRKYPVRNLCAACCTFVLDVRRLAKLRFCCFMAWPMLGDSTSAKALCCAAPSEGRRIIIAASGCEVAEAWSFGVEVLRCTGRVIMAEIG